MQECLHNCVINFDKTDSAQICFLGDAIVEDNDDGEMYDDVDEIKNQILGGQEDEQGKQEANGNNNVVDYIAINIKNFKSKMLNSSHPDQYAYSADKENLLNNQELLKLVIIFFILMTLMCNPGLML